jgi:RNA ligase
MRIQDFDSYLNKYRNIFIKREDGNKLLIKYRYYKPDIYSENPILRELRGIVFDKETGKVIHRPFPKFFNIEEPLCSISKDDNVIAVEKIDGTMIAVTYHDNNYLVTTPGSLSNDYTTKAYKIISENNEYKNIIESYEGNTLIFEYTAPNNRIVIPYNETKLHLLNIRNIKTGKLLEPFEIQNIANEYNIPTADIIEEGTVDEIINKIKLQKDTEGVVVYNNTDLAKIKTEWYLKLHRLLTSRMNPYDVTKLFFDNRIDDIYGYLYGKNKEIADKTLNKIMQHIDEYTDVIESINYDFESRKEFVDYVNNLEIPKEIRFIVYKKFEYPTYDYNKDIEYVIKSLAKKKRL